ncbi:transferase [Kitasatospora sp. NPDC058190]|uniref:transferase n=1 Tax=Kitasatospora sp. NPDC058190 TaxID=3346371 RepID=UPI0036DA4B23
MSSRLRAFARLITVLAVAAAYIALQATVAVGLDHQAVDRFRDARSRAVAFATALDRYGAGEVVALAELREGQAWFGANAPSASAGSRSITSAALRDAEAGAITSARGRAAGLATAVQREQAGQGGDLSVDRLTALVAGAVAAVLLGPALSLRRRRRSGAAELVGLVSRFAPPQSRWRPVFVLASHIGYMLFAGGSFTVSAAERDGRKVPLDQQLLLLLGGLAALALGFLILRRSRAHSARGAAQTLLVDGRRPVLYLRSFDDDEIAAQTDDAADVNLHSREEQFALALGAVGPVIAVGRPGEPLPRLGAARFYLPLDDWQPTVLRLMEMSQLIVLRLGPGEGLWWEVEQARATQQPGKLILLAPGTHWPELAVRLNGYLPAPLPLEAVGANVDDDNWISAVIAFDDGWTPTVFPVGRVRKGFRAWMWREALGALETPTAHLARTMRQALASVGRRRRTMVWRARFATQLSVWVGLRLLSAVALLVWLGYRVLQLVGFR